MTRTRTTHCIGLAILALFLTACGGESNGRSTRPAVNGTCEDPGGLPSAINCVQAGFTAELVAVAPDIVTRMAFASDGRLFFSVKNGAIRVIDAGGSLLATPFATLTVLNGAEQGLLGLALSPDFDSDGHMYVLASVNDGSNKTQVIRLTDSNDDNVSDSQLVLIDNLPTAVTGDAGDILFLPDGTFLVSIGDQDVPSSAQDDGGLAGRILRYRDNNGTVEIPSNNPYGSSDPEYCRGLRDSYDLCLHAGTGGVFGTENGPNSNDELNYIQSGKNYGWPDYPEDLPGSEVGLRIQLWSDVIVPTGLCFHDGTGWGDAFKDTIFLCSYDDERVLRVYYTELPVPESDQ